MTRERTFQLEDPSEPGRVVRGRITSPARAEGPQPWVLVLHGFKGFMDWGFFPLLARRLAQAGLTAVSFNASGSGIGADLQTFSELEAFRRDTLTRQLEDVERVRRLALSGELGPLDADRAGLFGHSRGGGVAIVHAAETGAWRALVTWAAVDTFDRWGEADKRAWRTSGSLPIVNARTGQVLPIDVGMLIDLEANAARLDVLAACRRLRTPTLLLHGTADEAVAFGALERLEQALPSGVGRAEALEGAGHTFGAVHPLRDVPVPLERALGASVAWLAQHLSGSGAVGDPVTTPGSDRT